MGYNLSENAYNQVKSILDELVDLKVNNIWKQSFQDNYKAARLIRQGFEYCIQNPDKVSKLHVELKKNIRIKVTNECVIAERKYVALQPLDIVAIRKKVFHGLITFNDVMTTTLANKQLTTLEFPDFNDSDKLSLLEKVCSAQGYIVEVEYDDLNTVSHLRILKDEQQTRDEKEHTG